MTLLFVLSDLEFLFMSIITDYIVTITLIVIEATCTSVEDIYSHHSIGGASHFLQETEISKFDLLL